MKMLAISGRMLLVGLSINTIFSACSSKEEVQDPASDAPSNLVYLSKEQYKNAAIELGNLSKKKIATKIKLTGRADVPPQNLVSISVAMSGYFRSSHLLPGMSVKKGEVIATLEDEQYVQLQQDYLTTKAEFAYLESEFKRQKELNDNKANSDKIFQQAKSSFEAKYAVLKSLEQKLKLIGLEPQYLSADKISRFIQVVSPVNGFVSAVHVNIGKYINPNDVMFEIIDPDDMHLILTVYEKDIHALEVGQTVWAYTNSKPNERFECEIILISHSIGNTEAAEVNCHFKHANNKLLPGTFMNAEVELNTEAVQCVPDEAIVQFENHPYLFVEDGVRVYKMISIVIGATENGYTAIANADALKNQKIVIRGAYKLLMALKNISDD